MMKLKALYTILILLTTVFYTYGQNKYTGFPSLVWPKLYDIKFEKKKDKLGEYDKPIFSAAAKSLNGKVITLPGYMIPFDTGSKGAKFMFSSMPINACFFCGVGGPESVVEVTMKQPLTFHDKPIEIKGILRLNDQDPDKMIYILEQAEFVGEVEM
ncbi:MAG: DUF3299 domain-containing protein [Cyclobacteriaceae bacterium]